MTRGVCLTMVLLAPASFASAETYDKYLWETPRVSNIDAEATADLVEQLRREVQRILDAGPLAPLRLSYADIPLEAYWLYYERGRIVTTLAYGYPHVTVRQQEAIKTYVRNLLADPKHAAYEAGIKGPTDGAVRALHGHETTEGRYISHYGESPTLHVLYGLWLYGDRSGDWDALKPYWTQIKARYTQGVAKEAVLYGQMSAHVAMARMAKKFGDDGLAKTAAEALTRDFDEGQSIGQIARRLERTRFRQFYEGRTRESFPGDCWVFLSASPEIMRFVADTQKQEAIRRADQMKSRYPLWWLHQAPYSTRWTGDEGVGTTPELIGMVYPVERWVAQAEAKTLATYMRSTPVGIGDSYWIESLVQTIEAFGEVAWKSVE